MGSFSVKVAGCAGCAFAKCLGFFPVVLLSVQSTSAPTMPLSFLPTDSPLPGGTKGRLCLDCKKLGICGGLRMMWLSVGQNLPPI